MIFFQHYGTKEPLINSWIDDLRFEMFQVKARSAAHSGIICEVRNADLDGFGRTAAFHELVRGSLITLMPILILQSYQRRIFF